MYDLFFSSGTGHSIMVLAFIIAIGLLLGKVSIKGISLGSVWILLVGILFGAAGVKADALFLHFIKEFGLVLFVFSIGLQAGPGFFTSFRGEGLKLNMMAILMVLLTVFCTLGVYACSREDLTTLVGIMTGSATSTPGLGTAQQTYYDVAHGTFLEEVNRPAVSSAIANAFAVAYPVGILVILLVVILLRRLFREDPGREGVEEPVEEVVEMIGEVVNPAIVGRRLSEALAGFGEGFVPSSVLRGESVLSVAEDPVLQSGDRIVLDAKPSDEQKARLFFGRVHRSEAAECVDRSGHLVSSRLIVTKPSMTGKKLSDLDILGKYGVSVARVDRSGIDLVASGDLHLQVGDVVKVRGDKEQIRKVADLLGNSMSSLEKPNLIPIFFGIGLGLIFGAIPLRFPGMSSVFRFGLAGGPFLIALLIGHFGPKMKVTTYTTASANKMIRAIGLSLLLATIGLGAGSSFCVNFDWLWLLYAVAIAVIPAVLTALVARYALKMNFSQICGLLTGTTTNVPVISYVESAYKSDRAMVSYATVFPFALFLQIMVAQLMILLSFVL